MKTKSSLRKHSRILFPFLLLILVALITPFLFIEYTEFKEKNKSFETEFPVTVNPRTETIIEDELVNAYLESETSPLQANVIASFSVLTDLFSSILISFSNLAAENSLALANNHERVVKIYPGQRKEEVIHAFTKTLGWSPEETAGLLTLEEGLLFPDTYVIQRNATPLEVKNLIEERFKENVLSRYSTTIEKTVPLEMTLTIASLIQKETIGTRDMRLVSGIIWNRIFADLRLELDATLQYVKASEVQESEWWPKVHPRDKHIESPYNTYQNPGLPPTPIANPSVAAIVAALNPLKTECYFYFHDDNGDIHCSLNYEEHVSKLKELYGRGK